MSALKRLIERIVANRDKVRAWQRTKDQGAGGKDKNAQLQIGRANIQGVSDDERTSAHIAANKKGGHRDWRAKYKGFSRKHAGFKAQESKILARIAKMLFEANERLLSK